MSNEIIKVELPDRVTGGAIAAFQNALMQMDDYRKDLAEAEDWEALCHGLTNLIEFKQNLSALVEAIQHDILMTETLPLIYLEQKNYEKAIQSYKILSLKYPEKSGFFADQIKAIKILQKNKS